MDQVSHVQKPSSSGLISGCTPSLGISKASLTAAPFYNQALLCFVFLQSSWLNSRPHTWFTKALHRAPPTTTYVSYLSSIILSPSPWLKVSSAQAGLHPWFFSPYIPTTERTGMGHHNPLHPFNSVNSDTHHDGTDPLSLTQWITWLCLPYLLHQSSDLVFYQKI